MAGQDSPGPKQPAYDEDSSKKLEDPSSPLDATANEPPMKKRRRGPKANCDKRFECKHEGCGKSYSRAEHLYRHQLNHTPKNIYRCDYPDCNRYFVRQDLCQRHRERHTTSGSQLQKRDTFAQNTDSQVPIDPAHTEAQNPPLTVSSTLVSLNHQDTSTVRALHSVTSRRPATHSRRRSNPNECTGISNSTASASTDSVESRYDPPTPRAIFSGSSPAIHRSNSFSSYAVSPQQRHAFPFNPLARQNSFGSNSSQKNHCIPTRPIQIGTHSHTSMRLSPSILRHNSSSAHAEQHQYFEAPTPTEVLTNPLDGHRPHQNVEGPVFSPLEFSPSNMQRASASFAAAVSNNLSTLDSNSTAPYASIGDDVDGLGMTSFACPVFGGDEYNRSPNAMAEEFAQWLFNENQSTAFQFSPAPRMMSTYADAPTAQVQGPFYSVDHSGTSFYPDASTAQHAMSLMNIVDSSTSSQYIMSEEKRQELLHLMTTQFNERPHDAVNKRKAAVFEGDIDAEGHILSLRMMHTYIGSYWYHQHAQLPILHKPTFSADKTPNLLLLAVIAIGAATLDKVHGTALTDSAAEFANFVVWHLRWEIMRDADFQPPAKLWVFQTLLLVETYEKMYSTRALHERAHIHHDSTLTLMRRGSSLIGRSAFDSPPSLREGKTGRSSGSTSSSDNVGGEETWARWITNEATRRVAFAAFAIDSIHATMFGHSAKMVAHEMRLPLPCDEGLWSATSAAEVARVQSALQTNGIKPTMFLDGLKKTLNGQRVRTNSFGRTILMAGLLSVSWHMNQRDLSISSLGAQTFGGRDQWRSALLRAFDNWKRDFDEALLEATASSSDYPTPLSRSLAFRPIDDENIFESRTVLHHLAHMASHVDIVDCQIFAGADRLMGRSITPRDYSNIREKITTRWATRASARDAAFYALKFLAQVLIPPYENERFGHASPILPLAFDQNQYLARDDFLLNRPWVLYFSTLVVWCYGYALEGPIVPTLADGDLATPEQKDKDMRDYLDRVGGIKAPDDLEGVKGKNRCLGLLLILKESFSLTRWELTHEAANLLGNCIRKLKGLDNPASARGGTPAIPFTAMTVKPTKRSSRI